MTREEYFALLDAAAHPDTGIDALSTLKENGKELFDNLDSLTTKVTENETRIRDLQDSNMKLFLRIGSPDQTKEEPDESETLLNEFNAMFTE